MPGNISSSCRPRPPRLPPLRALRRLGRGICADVIGAPLRLTPSGILADFVFVEVATLAIQVCPEKRTQVP